jgi:4-hydroxy-4-methyl-2-oxoglutarate aldolase
MIEDPPLLAMARHMSRPSPEVVEKFRNAPTSFIVDALGGRGALDWRIKPIGKIMPFAGVAFTCNCGPADNLALCAAVAKCQPGDVIVAAANGFTASSVVGDLLLGIAKNRGAVAFVTDGLVRDQNDIEGLDFPCYAMGATPNSPARNGPGEVGLPIQCGGLSILSGDIVVGDRDGVVIVPYKLIDQTLANLADVRKAEAAMLEKVKAGLTEVSFVTNILEGQRLRMVDV